MEVIDTKSSPHFLEMEAAWLKSSSKEESRLERSEEPQLGCHIRPQLYEL